MLCNWPCLLCFSMIACLIGLSYPIWGKRVSLLLCVSLCVHASVCVCICMCGAGVRCHTGFQVKKFSFFFFLSGCFLPSIHRRYLKITDFGLNFANFLYWRRKKISNRFLFSPSLQPPPQFNSKYVTLTTEMYLKYKGEEEISPHKYGEVARTHMQIMWALRSVPYRRLPEHSALCATVCKTKLDKCSPHTVDHWCSGLGLKLCWEIGMCRIQLCFCWSEKPKLWNMFRIKNSKVQWT